MATSGSAKLRTFLLADASVVALVGTSVYTPRAKDAIEFPSVIFRVVAGPGAGNDTNRAQSFEFRFYDETELGAVALYETARTALLGDPTDTATYRAAMRDAGLVRAEEEVEGQPLYGPDGPAKDIPFVLGNFTVVFHDE